jgi:hypothetical protein
MESLFSLLFAGGISVFYLLFCFLYCIFIIVALIGLVLWLVMLFDVVQRRDDQFGEGNTDSKTMWILLLILGGWISAIIYYILIYKKYPRY